MWIGPWIGISLSERSGLFCKRNDLLELITFINRTLKVPILFTAEVVIKKLRGKTMV